MIVHIKGSRKLDVVYVVESEADVSYPRNLRGLLGIPVILDALDEGGGAVADSCDRDADLSRCGDLMR